MLGVAQVKLYVPVKLFTVTVGTVTLFMVNVVVTEHPPAAVTVTLVGPVIRPLAVVCVLDVTDAGVGFQFTV